MADQFQGIFVDGELFLPPDIFTPSSTITTPTLPSSIYTTPTPSPMLPDLQLPKLFEPMGLKGSNASLSADYFASRYNLAMGNSRGGFGGGSIWSCPRPLIQNYPTFNPVQPQFRRERDWDMHRQQGRWFLHSRVVENRIVRVDGGCRVGLNGSKTKGSCGGTGVFLPNYATIDTTTISTRPKKRNSVRVTKQSNKACLKRCSPNEARVRKEVEYDFELNPEKALPQEWTY